jgi:hypothetical protein
MGRLRRSACLALAIMAAPAATAAKGEPASPDWQPPPDPPPARSAQEGPLPPRLIIVPQLTVANDPAWWLSAEVGASAAYRTPFGLDAGLHFAWGGAAAGMDESGGRKGVALWRVGAMLEHHLNPTGLFDPWVGLQADVIHAEETRSVWPYQSTVSLPHTGAVFVPMIGLDVVGRWERALAGFGVFFAIPCRVMSGAGGYGISAGIRLPLGGL